MENEQADAGRDSNTTRETKLSGANRDREIPIFSVQLTTSRIDNLIQLIYTLLYVMTIHIYYMMFEAQPISTTDKYL